MRLLTGRTPDLFLVTGSAFVVAALLTTSKEISYHLHDTYLSIPLSGFLLLSGAGFGILWCLYRATERVKYHPFIIKLHAGITIAALIFLLIALFKQLSLTDDLLKHGGDNILVQYKQSWKYITMFLGFMLLGLLVWIFNIVLSWLQPYKSK